MELVLDDGTRILAHKVVLASSSGFFYAQLCGSGRHMLQGLGVSPPASDVALPHAAPILQLPLRELRTQPLLAVLEAIYTGALQVW